MKIQLTIKEILSVINVERCDCADGLVIDRIASLSGAQEHDLAIVFDRGDASVFDPISIAEVSNSMAGVFLARTPTVHGKNYILVPDVLTAFTTLVNYIESKQKNSLASQYVQHDAIIHESAIISSGATIGNNTEIRALVYVGKNCIIGNNVLLHPGCKILDGCCVGDNTIIHAGAVIGSDGFGYEVTKLGLRKIPQIGTVRIGTFAEIGANCMIDRASFDETIIGDGVKIDNGVHIAHNVIIGAGSAILAQTGIAGSTRIGQGCQIGGHVAIKDHLNIGNNVRIVSKSAVMNDLKDGETVAGIPAIPFMQWKRLSVALNKIPELLKQFGDTSIVHAARKSWWHRWFF